MSNIARIITGNRVAADRSGYRISSEPATGATRVMPNHLPGDERCEKGRANLGRQFIQAMRSAIAGVTIVSTDGRAGRFGVTVSAFTSVSAEPPLVLVCINRSSPVSAAIEQNACFSVNILSVGHHSLAMRFAGWPSEGEAFDFGRADWQQLETGAPVLRDAIAGFDCTVGLSFDAGSHRVFVGRVESVVAHSGESLAYTNRSFGRASPLDSIPSSAPRRAS